MTIILDKLNNEVIVDGEKQKFIFSEPNSSLTVQTTVVPTVEVKTKTSVELLDGLGRGVILENYAEVTSNTTRLKYVDALGNEQLVFSSTNGELSFGGTLELKSLIIKDYFQSNNASIGHNLSVSNEIMVKKITVTGDIGAVGNITCTTLKQNGDVTETKQVTTKEYVDSKITAVNADIVSQSEALTKIIKNNSVFAYLYSSYSTPLTTADHIQFLTPIYENQVNAPFIVFDKTTAYTTTLNVASRGRFLLRANKTYRLYMHMANSVAAATTNTLFGYVWYNASTGNPLIEVYALCTAWCTRTYTSTGGNNAVGTNTTLYTVGTTDTWVEVRPYSSMSESVFGRSSGITSMVLIEQLD